MQKFLCVAVALFVVFLLFPISSSAQITQNTSACYAANTPSYCWAQFVPKSGSEFNPSAGEVSTVDIHCLVPYGTKDQNGRCSNVTTKIFAHLTPWFCHGPSNVTGNNSYLCNGHIQTGYTYAFSNRSELDTMKAAVNGQLNDMQSRSMDGAVVDWYGGSQTGTNALVDPATMEFAENLSLRCTAAQNCPMYFVLMEDQGIFSKQLHDKHRGRLR